MMNTMYEYSEYYQFQMPVKRLYQCFYKTELLVQWFVSQDLALHQIVMSLQKGAEFEWVFRNEQGQRTTYTGQFAEIFPEEQLIFTLKPEQEYETALDIRFERTDEGSQLHVIQSQLIDDAAYEQAVHDWQQRARRLALLTDTVRV